MMRNCPRCHKDFLYTLTEVSRLSRVAFPLGSVIICQECDKKERITAADVNIGNSVLCAAKGCSNDANEFSKYCNCCYDEKFQFN